jgi:hypothetical protein
MKSLGRRYVDGLLNVVYEDRSYIVTDYGLEVQGLIPGRGKRYLSTPQHPDQLWSPHSPVSNRYWGLFLPW